MPYRNIQILGKIYLWIVIQLLYLILDNLDMGRSMETPKKGACQCLFIQIAISDKNIFCITREFTYLIKVIVDKFYALVCWDSLTNLD